MQHKLLISCVILLFGFALTGVPAQTMNIKESSGTQVTYSLNSVQKMTFSEGNVNVLKIDNSIVGYSLSGLRYFNFSKVEDVTSIISEPSIFLDFSTLNAYPNPVLDLLTIDLSGIMGEGIITIMTLEGKTIQMQTAIGKELITMNLSSLSNGIYLCRYSGTEEVRTVKIVKQ